MRARHRVRRLDGGYRSHLPRPPGTLSLPSRLERKLCISIETCSQLLVLPHPPTQKRLPFSDSQRGPARGRDGRSRSAHPQLNPFPQRKTKIKSPVKGVAFVMELDTDRYRERFLAVGLDAPEHVTRQLPRGRSLRHWNEHPAGQECSARLPNSPY